MARTLIKTKTAGWFIEPGSDKKVRKQPGDTILTEAEFAAKAVNAEKKAVKLSSGKIAHGPTTTITCVEPGCTEKRVIMKQDEFQATRCLDHQKDHRNKLRRDKRAAKK